MAKVYSNSLCNLMATGTSVDAGGLFSHRAPAISVNTAILKATDLGLKLRSRTGDIHDEELVCCKIVDMNLLNEIDDSRLNK